MKRFVILLLTVFILACSLTGCGSKPQKQETDFEPIDYDSLKDYNFDCKLYVDRVEVSTDNLVGINLKGRIALVPVVKIIEAAGGNVEWDDYKTAKITINGSRFVLDTVEHTLYCTDKSFPNWQFLEIPPGEKYSPYAHALEKELVIDSFRFYNFVYEVMNARIIVDVEDSSVSINYIND